MASHIGRRKFLATLGGAAVAWPLAARAQEPGRTYRLGFLIPSGRKSPWVLAFLDELRLNGFIEGQNLTIIPGGFDAQVDGLAERAEALVKAEPDAIVGGPEPQLRVLQAATRTIPLIGMSNIDISEINNADLLKTLLPKTAAATAAFGGKNVAVTENIVALDGTPPKRFVIISFDSIDKAKAWYNSPAQEEINAIRKRSTNSRSFIVDGTLP